MTHNISGGSRNKIQVKKKIEARLRSVDCEGPGAKCPSLYPMSVGESDVFQRGLKVDSLSKFFIQSCHHFRKLVKDIIVS